MKRGVREGTILVWLLAVLTCISLIWTALAESKRRESGAWDPVPAGPTATPAAQPAPGWWAELATPG